MMKGCSAVSWKLWSPNPVFDRSESMIIRAESFVVSRTEGK